MLMFITELMYSVYRLLHSPAYEQVIIFTLNQINSENPLFVCSVYIKVIFNTLYILEKCCIVRLMMPSGLITRSHLWPAWSSGTACLKPTRFHNYCYAGRTTRSTLGVELNNNDQHLE